MPSTEHTVKVLLIGGIIASFVGTNCLGQTQEVIFFEDFEGHGAGNSVLGANGWVAPNGGLGDLIVGLGTGLTTGNVLNGRVQPGAGPELYSPINIYSPHPYWALPKGKIYELKYEVYPTADGDGWVGFALQSSFPVAGGWEIKPGGNLLFDSRQISTSGINPVFYANGLNCRVTLGVVIDTVNEEVYGTYDIGLGTFETVKHPLRSLYLDRIDRLMIVGDHRVDRVGVEVDNISLIAQVTGHIPLVDFALSEAGGSQVYRDWYQNMDYIHPRLDSRMLAYGPGFYVGDSGTANGELNLSNWKGAAQNGLQIEVILEDGVSLDLEHLRFHIGRNGSQAPTAMNIGYLSGVGHTIVDKHVNGIQLIKKMKNIKLTTGPLPPAYNGFRKNVDLSALPVQTESFTLVFYRASQGKQGNLRINDITLTGTMSPFFPQK